jgi:hypothetical protein
MRPKPSTVGPCGGTQIWNKDPERHWCLADEQETILGRLSGAHFMDVWIGYVSPDWTPGAMFMKGRGFSFTGWLEETRGPDLWYVVRFNTECPYRRASVDQRPTRAREKGDDERQPVAKRRLRKGITR